MEFVRNISLLLVVSVFVQFEVVDHFLGQFELLSIRELQRSTDNHLYQSACHLASPVFHTLQIQILLFGYLKTKSKHELLISKK